MDETERAKFKVMFMTIVVMLNIVVLMYALAILLFFLLRGEARLPASLLLLGGAVWLSHLTWRRYLRTKEWLEQHADEQAD